MNIILLLTSPLVFAAPAVVQDEVSVVRTITPELQSKI